MDAPVAESLIVTVCIALYVPAARLKVGVAVDGGGSYSHKSFREPGAELDKRYSPPPPKSQKLPLSSTQLDAYGLFPGMFPVAEVPNVP
jgi:hypothetical protein